MKKLMLATAFLAAAGVAVQVIAQPPRGDEAGERGPRDRGPRPGGPDGGDRFRPGPPDGPRDGRGGRPDMPPPPNPFMEALDADGDRIISAAELENAKAALLTLDKNSDGQLSDEETRPAPPQGRGPREGGPGPDARGPRDGGPGPDGRGPRDGEPRPGERGPREFGPGPDGRGPRDGGPGAEGRGPNGPGPEGRGPMGPPSPERMVDAAMQFDADGDGKLDREELTKFAEDMMSRRFGPDGGPGREGQRPGGDGPPFGGRGPGAGGPPFGGRPPFGGNGPQFDGPPSGRRPFDGPPRGGEQGGRPPRPESEE